MKAVSLNELGQQIEEVEERLKSLREEFQIRRGDLATLEERKKELQRQLQQVEREIAARIEGEVGGMPAAGAAAPSATKKAPGKKPEKKPKPKSVAAKVKAQPSLREVVTDIMKQARKPLMPKELADRALASGYQTKSKNLPGLVQDLLKRMENVERVPGEGHRLKRGAA